MKQAIHHIEAVPGITTPPIELLKSSPKRGSCLRNYINALYAKGRTDENRRSRALLVTVTLTVSRWGNNASLVM